MRMIALPGESKQLPIDVFSIPTPNLRVPEPLSGQCGTEKRAWEAGKSKCQRPEEKDSGGRSDCDQLMGIEPTA